jgi:hypothetical protein
MESNLPLPTGNPQTDGRYAIPLTIKYHPNSDAVSEREVDLVLSFLDEIIQEMQRLASTS